MANSDTQIIEWLNAEKQVLQDRALVYLYKENIEKINRYISNNSGSMEDAEEVLQDALVVTFKKVRQADFKLTAKLDTFIYAVCRNIWYKKLRKKKIKVVDQEIDANRYVEDRELDFVIEEEESPILKYINQLTDSCIKILSMYFFEEKGIKEMTTILKYKNDQVVRNKKSLCLKRLKTLMANYKHES